MTKTIEERVEKLEAIEAIRELKGVYCQTVDGGWDHRTHDGDRYAELFTEDATLEFVIEPVLGKSMRCEGREEIRSSINAASAATYASHNMCGERIDIDGDVAHATWHAMNYITYAGYTYVATLIYYENYLRLNGKWLIANIRAVTRGIHPLANGTALSRPGAKAVDIQ